MDFCVVYACENPRNFWMPEPIFIKLSMYIMAPEPISMVYLTNPFHQSVCVCIPPIVARQRLGKQVSAATNTRNNKIIVGRVCLWVYVSPYRY
jgi:hypothetical protein